MNNERMLKETTMVKSELINHIALKHDSLSFKDVELSVNHLIEYMSAALAEGERIEVRGFGSFSLHLRPPRNARNPKTGEWVFTEEKHTPHFKPGKELRERVNQNRSRFAIVADNGKDD